MRARCSFSAHRLIGVFEDILWGSQAVTETNGGRGTAKDGCVRPPALSARVGMNWIKATRLPISYRNHHPRRPDIDTTDMDDMQKSLSKLKKGFKHRLGGKKRGADRAGANPVGETTGSSLSLTRLDSRVTTSVRDEEGGGVSTVDLQAHSRDRSPHPKPMQADEGGDNPQEDEADVDEQGANQSRSRLGPDVGGAGGSRPSQEIKRAPSPPSVTPISPKQEADGTWALSSQ